MNKNTKFLAISAFSIILLFLIIFPALAQCTEKDNCPNGEFVQNCCPGESLNTSHGIVPCGSPCCPCTLCHFFVLIERVLEFIFFNITPPLALLMLIIGGGMFMLAAGDPTKISTARRIITNTLIGVVIIYGAFFLVGLLLQSINLNTWLEPQFKTWWEDGFFNIDCRMPGSTPALPSPPVAVIPPAAAFAPPIAPGAGITIIPIGSTFSSGATVITFP